MVVSPEWLPPGFTVKIKHKSGKKLKYYLHVATGKKYNSKNEVIRCAEENNKNLHVTPLTKNADVSRPSVNKVDAVSEKTNDSAWLPNGWTVEERRRKSGSAAGLSYKVYTEMSTGSKFYSKASITRYLDDVARSDVITNQNNIDKVDDPFPDTYLHISPMRNTRSISLKKRKADSLIKIDNVDETVTEKLQQILSTTNTDGTHEQRRDRNSLVKKIDNVGEPFPDMSPQVVSTTNKDGIRKMKKKISSFVTVAVECTTDDDLPKGWIKEIRTSKLGNKIRKDPFYTDPVSGYMFRSKPDALRYLKTNDIRSCACKPLKRELDDIKSMENRNHVSFLGKILGIYLAGAYLMAKAKAKLVLRNLVLSSMANNREPSLNDVFREVQALATSSTSKARSPFSAASQKAFKAHCGFTVLGTCFKSSSQAKLKGQPFLGEESNGGAEIFGAKSPAESGTNTMKREQVDQENSNKSAEMGNNPEPESEVSKKGVKVVAVDASTSSVGSDPLTNQQLPESGGRNKTGSRKSKKRRESGTPLRISRRLAGSEPEMQLNLDLNEHSLRGYTAKEVNASPTVPHEASDIPKTSNIQSAKEVVEKADIGGEETRQDVNRPKEVENPPLTDGSTVSEELSGATATASTNPLWISRRFAGSEPEMQLNLDLNEPSLRGSTAKEVDASSIVPHEASGIPKTSNILPATEVVVKANIGSEETRQDVNNPKKVEKPPLTEGSTVPEEQSGATATASTNPLVDGQQSHASQLCYDFGDYWTDPLEFSLKILKGELPIEDTLTFPSCFREPLDTTISQIDGCLKQSQFDVPVNFQSEFRCQSESSKKQNAVDPAPATALSSFSALGFSCSGGFNLQPSAEVRKKDSQTKFNP
ncbi:hypothetical protein SASPL_133360 [Salvia splendens]|uniref:MBD domain-containing protein n=1 Tax=Salvia splendens TaxID=180675 RepID=A0A8X8X5E1_SALSN|nr:hypothetical protein SASPL_133360 [Salvia splendens]